MNSTPTPTNGGTMDVVQIDDDLCDTCGCRAFIYADHDAWASPLAWCMHHGNENLQRLNEIGATVINLAHAVHP